MVTRSVSSRLRWNDGTNGDFTSSVVNGRLSDEPVGIQTHVAPVERVSTKQIVEGILCRVGILGFRRNPIRES